VAVGSWWPPTPAAQTPTPPATSAKASVPPTRASRTGAVGGRGSRLARTRVASAPASPTVATAMPTPASRWPGLNRVNGPSSAGQARVAGVQHGVPGQPDQQQGQSAGPQQQQPQQPGGDRVRVGAARDRQARRTDWPGGVIHGNQLQTVAGGPTSTPHPGERTVNAPFRPGKTGQAGKRHRRQTRRLATAGFNLEGLAGSAAGASTASRLLAVASGHFPAHT
jgi:hypothetical protein